MNIQADEIERNRDDQDDELCAIRSIFPELYKHSVNSSQLAFEDPTEEVSSSQVLEHNLFVHLDTSSLSVQLVVENQHAIDFPISDDGSEPGGDDPHSPNVPSVGTIEMHKLDFLPPFTLSWAYPESYPSHGLPSFNVTCEWMTQHQLSRISEALTTLAQEAGGMPTIFAWHTFLSEPAQVLEVLGLGDSITIRTGCQSADVNDSCHDRKLALALLQYDHQMREKAFRDGWHSCQLCFEEKQGCDFHRLSCSHTFCTECLAEMASVHVREGSLEALACPIPECAARFCLNSLRTLLSEGDFARWGELNTTKELQALSGVKYCPRCDPSALPDPRAAILCPALSKGERCSAGDGCAHAHAPEEVLEPVACLPESEGDPLYVCWRCSFAFCGECMSGYHPGIECGAAEHADHQETAINRRLEQLQTQGESRSMALIRKLQQEREKLMSERLLRRTSPGYKKCPTCKMGIEKTGGCNHMRCAACSTHFCWLCLQVLTGDPYKHFAAAACPLSGGHALAPDRPAAPYNAAIQNVGRALRAAEREVASAVPSVVCPRCRGRIFKETPNNHLVCSSCTTSVCFLCRTVVRRPASHFSMLHPQHSDPKDDLPNAGPRPKPAAQAAQEMASAAA